MTNLTELTDSLEPAPQLYVDDLETLKLVSDSLRAQLLDLLRPQARTAKELAELLTLSPKKLYYHLNLMEQHGLIRVVSTRVVSGIIEKSYRATAYLFYFDDALFKSMPADAPAQLPTGIAAIFDTTRNQLQQSIADGLVDLREAAPRQHQLLTMWMLQRLSVRQSEEFYRRFEALLTEFGQSEVEADASEAHNFRLFFTLFPVQAFLDKAAVHKEQT